MEKAVGQEETTRKNLISWQLVTTVNLPIELKLRTQRLSMSRNGITQRIPLGERCVTSQKTAVKETTFRKASEKLVILSSGLALL